MAYYTGTVGDYDDLFDILINRCVGHGWTWSDGILSKGKAFLKVWVSYTSQTVAAPYGTGSGIVIQGGTGQSGGNLVNSSTAVGRLGRPEVEVKWKPVTWPAIYHLHIFENPDEVFLILNFDVLYHFWLAFGVSDIPGQQGTGLWFHGLARQNATTSIEGFEMSPTSGAIKYSGVTGFLAADRVNNAIANYSIHTAMDGTEWTTSFNAWQTLSPLPARSPNNWNQEAVLLPIHGYINRPEGKRSCALIVRNARYIRVDNYEVGDTITLGPEKWQVYPFYFKNVDGRNGGTQLNHSGTFGWAIRV